MMRQFQQHGGPVRRGPLEVDSASEIRSASSGASLTPPSSPGGSTVHGAGDGAGAAGVGKPQYSGLKSEEVYAAYLREKQRRERRRRRAEAKAKAKAAAARKEDPGVRFGRFVLTGLCYLPLFVSWFARHEDLQADLGPLRSLPLLLAASCVAVSAVKELFLVDALAGFFPLLSFGAGVVGGSFSPAAMRELQVSRLLAVCLHGIFAGQLRRRSDEGGAPAVGLLIPLAAGELLSMYARSALTELTAVAASYALLLLLLIMAAGFPLGVMSLWVQLFGVEQGSSEPVRGKRSLVQRLASGVVWAVSAATPIVIALSAAGGILFFCLPPIWAEMVFVAPFGILFEGGSASCGERSKSLFYSEMRRQFGSYQQAPEVAPVTVPRVQ